MKTFVYTSKCLKCLLDHQNECTVLDEWADITRITSLNHLMKNHDQGLLHFLFMF